jgi:hypothetical protein
MSTSSIPKIDGKPWNIVAFGVSWRWLLAFAVLAHVGGLSTSLTAQPMSGTYTCATGNPGGAFDYADIGLFFTALESTGMGGPVILDVYDDGGVFTSNSS